MSAPEASYTPGNWVTVAGPSCWLITELAPADPAIGRCWTLIRQHACVDELLDVLAAGGLRAAPSFGLVGAYPTQAGSGMRVVVRGAANAVITDCEGEQTPTRAQPGSTWLDQVLDVPPKEITLVAGPGAAGGEFMLPLSAGVTMAAAVRIVADGSEAATEPTDPRVAAAEAEPTAVIPVVAPTPEEPDAPSYDHLFGDTRLFVAGSDEPDLEPAPEPIPVAGPAQHPQPAQRQPVAPEVRSWPTLPAPVDAPAKDDGLISSVPWSDPAASGPVVGTGPDDDLADIEATVSRPYAASKQGAEPTVLALRCASEHLNPPTAVACRVCGGTLQGQPFAVERPVFGVLRLPTGDCVPLDRGVLLGRAPDAASAGQGGVVHVVRLSQAGPDVSRTHLEVAVEGWHVLVTDLGSTNGTTVTPPERETVRLRPHDPVLIEPGTSVHLGGEVEIRYEVVA